MAKVILYVALSLDGQIARADGSVDWLPEPEEGEDFGFYDFYNPIGSLVMGYKTYEISISLGEWFYKGKASYIFSRNPDRQLVPEAQLITSDPVDFVRELRQNEEKDIWLVGGGEIVRLLHEEDLIDRYVLTYIPIILGEGVPLFPGILREQKLNLSRVDQFSGGVLSLVLDREQD